MKFRKYLGDSVYATVDSGMIRLEADERKVIFLEPEVFTALAKFAEEAWNLKITIEWDPGPQIGREEHPIL